MKKSKHSASFIVVCIGILIVLSSFILFVLPELTKPATSVVLGDGIFKADVLSTDYEVSKGLSGCKTIKETEACLIVYGSEQKWEVSIEDQQDPVDIVWLDVNKKVVYAVSNVSKDNKLNVVLKPKTNAKYVLEFIAGTIKSKAINSNRKAIFEIEK